jgi:hypothetical protein
MFIQFHVEELQKILNWILPVFLRIESTHNVLVIECSWQILSKDLLFIFMF